MVLEKKEITTKEAGAKGGNITSKRYGPEFYQAIGRKGGQTIKKLIKKGKKVIK